MLGMLSGAWRFRYFIVSSVRTELRLKFVRSRLGGLWMILNPLSQVLATLGVAFVIADFSLWFWGGDPRPVSGPDFLSGSVRLFGEEVLPVLRKEYADKTPAHIPEPPTHAGRVAATLASAGQSSSETASPKSV